jgi:hypothetical protein
MAKNINPVVKEVVDKFNTVHEMTKLFVSNKYSALKGLLISGDAGTGKTHWVQKAFIDMDKTEDVYYVKAASISAAALYCIFYQYRYKNKVVVLDDCDIIHKTGKDKSDILDMLKGVTEVTKGPRFISWEKASPNQLMRDNNIPTKFEFKGSVVWITNDTIEDISKKCKSHWNALSSRFNQIKVYFTEQEKLLYTLYLIEECDMLGKNCEGKEGGYSLKIQSEVIDYINDNYKNFKEITPRLATKIADIRHNFPKNWKKLVSNQL